MGFLDDLANSLTKVSNDVAGKAKEMADVTKLKMQTSAEETKLKDAYTELGRLFAEKWTGEVPAELAPYMEIVKDTKEKIASLKAQTAKAKGVKVCPVCGEELPMEVSFCSRCGARVETPAEESPEEAVKEAMDKETKEVVNAAEETVQEVKEAVQEIKEAASEE